MRDKGNASSDKGPDANIGCRRTLVEVFNLMAKEHGGRVANSKELATRPPSRAENKTNNAGVTSVDRSTKATLTLTVPGCVLSRLQKIYHPQV